MKNLKNIIVVHHSADQDGLMSGTIALNMYKQQVKDGFVKLYGYNYQEKHDFMREVAPVETNKLFQFIDVTPTIDWLESVRPEIEAGTIEIQIFDHHQQKYDDIEALKLNIEYHFSQEWCGAKIYLNHWIEILNGNLLNNDNVSQFFDAKIRKYVDMVDCYDTWKFVQKTNYMVDLYFHESFASCKTVEDFDSMMMFLSMDEIINQGIILWRARVNKDVPYQIGGAKYVEYPIGHPAILIQGEPTFEIQEFLKQKFLGKILLFIFYNFKLKENKFNLSLRSNTPHTINCSQYARELNPTGGGHYEAAGCFVSTNDFLRLFADDYEHQYVDCDSKRIKDGLSDLQQIVKETPNKILNNFL